MSEKKNNRRTISSLKLFRDIIIKNEEDIFEKSFNKKKEMITYKNLQNLDLTTYDFIFLDRQLSNTTTQDFSSFTALIKQIKNKFKPDLLTSRDMQTIKLEGKFSFNKYNITKLVCFHDKKIKNLEMSINSKYILANEIKNKIANFFVSKSLFKGKHCFEIQILNTNGINLYFGLLNINYFDMFKKEYCKSNNNDLNYKLINYNLLHNFEIFKIENPIFIKKNNDIYHHYISYGDILGFCIDLNKKLFHLYLNGELINTLILDLDLESNTSYSPVISFGRNTEILFNPGENLKYKESYKNMGFIPLDKDYRNNYETSQLKNVTKEYLNILINNGKSIINNKNITYSDINQIYHEIFDFLGNIAFQHSYIIQKCFIENILNKNEDNYEDLELYYICIKYILNSVKEQKILLKNIILNLVESIHLNLKLGNIIFRKSYNLLSYLFSKKDIIKIISQFRPSTMSSIFSQIFTSLNSHEDIFQKINLDFIIKLENPINIKLEEKEKIFKDVVTNFDTFHKYLITAQNEYMNQNIPELFSNIVEILLKNGIEQENQNMLDNFIIKNLNDFLKTKKEEINKCVFVDKKLCLISEILKAFFIPGMLLFNNEYNKEQKKENNLISYSIKKYIEDTDSEKLGGTEKTINEQFIKDIPNYEEINKMKINSFNDTFLCMFSDFFLKSAGNIWDSINQFVNKYEEFSKIKFINCVNKESSETMHNRFIRYIENKLYYPNFTEMGIVVNFLNNYVNFLLDEIYPKKLIYLFPENIFYYFGRIITFLKNILNKISFKNDFIEYYLNINSPKNNAHLTKIETEKKNLENICKKCFKQYITFLAKIISDKNIKKIPFKCDIFNILQNSIKREEFYTDQEFFYIFDFANEIHNNSEYKIFVHEFIKIFDNKIIEIINGQNTFNNLGNRIYDLCKTNNDNNILRIVLALLYSEINYSLSKLEESFAEYKFKPRSNTRSNIPNNNNNDNNNDDNNIEVNIEDNNANEIGFQFQLIRQLFQARGGNPIVIFRNIAPRRNIEQLSDQEKLGLLHDSLKNIYSKFSQLINFYLLCHDIKLLYDFNSFENKYLNNLLVSLYNIVFAPNNSNKITDNNVMNSYKKLHVKILKFYKVIFNIINNLKDENILKEISKRRNIYHLKEIGECFNKLNEQKDQKNEENKNKTITVSNLIKNNNEKTDTKYYNDFVSYLEELIPEKDIFKLINVNNTPGNSAVKTEEKNLCSICADSTIDTHILPCEHSICRNCFYQCLSGNKACPFCRVQIQGIKEDKNFKI